MASRHSHTALPRWAGCMQKGKESMTAQALGPFLSPVGMRPGPHCSGCDKPSPGRSRFAVLAEWRRKDRLCLLGQRKYGRPDTGPPPGARKRSGKNLVFPREPAAASSDGLQVISALRRNNTPPMTKSRPREQSSTGSAFLAMFAAANILALSPLTSLPWRRLQRRSRLLSWPGPRPSQSGRSS